jgi:hypothetical protein
MLLQPRPWDFVKPIRECKPSDHFSATCLEPSAFFQVQTCLRANARVSAAPTMDSAMPIHRWKAIQSQSNALSKVNISLRCWNEIFITNAAAVTPKQLNANSCGWSRNLSAVSMHEGIPPNGQQDTENQWHTLRFSPIAHSIRSPANSVRSQGSFTKDFGIHRALRGTKQQLIRIIDTIPRHGSQR